MSQACQDHVDDCFVHTPADLFSAAGRAVVIRIPVLGVLLTLLIVDHLEGLSLAGRQADEATDSLHDFPDSII